MRFLLITQYFTPETGAPQNRLWGLVREMKKKGEKVDVLTAMPNYPKMEIQEEYKGKKFLKESMDGLDVYRAWIYVSRSRSILSRLMNYFSFVFSSWYYSKRIKADYDYVICESPPLFTGMSARRIARRKKAKLIFNVSDLWPESAEKLGLIRNRFLLNSAYRLERKLYRSSVLVTGQTRGICKDITGRFPEVKTHWLPNGIDENRFDPGVFSEWRNENGFGEKDFLLLYAGIIGHAQGLEVILDAAERLRDKESIQFILLGDGPEKKSLIENAGKRNLRNIRFFEPVPAGRMQNILRTIDAAVIPLKKIELFKGAIPSKIFEALAMKKPILLGVEGEAKALFIEEGKCGLFFEPENGNDLAEKVLELQNDPSMRDELGKNGLNYVNTNFLRSKITGDFLDALKKV